MKTIVRESRASEEYARTVFHDLYEHEKLRRTCAQLLADSVSVAHHVSPSCWSLTLFPEKVRLNAGPVEVLVFRSNEIFLIIDSSDNNHFDESLSNDFITSSDVYYSSVPGTQRLCYVPPEKVAEFYPQVVAHHHKFIQKAAKRRKKTTWESSFSPGVIRYLNKSLGISLPMPAYFSGEDDGFLFPDQVSPEKTYLEGSVSKVLVNAYERNPEARKKCIEHYGVACSVCEFNFEEMYGTVAKGFVHVHHLRPLSEINERYEVNPIVDLRPVCANCHAMIHRRIPPFSIEEMKILIKENS